MTWVFAAPAPKGADRMMLLALADNANDEGVCWPSMPTLARKCAVGVRSAQRTVRRLDARGYIRTEERPGRSTLYHLLEEKLTPDADDTPGAGDTPTPDASDTPPPTSTPPEPSVNRHLNQQHASHAREDVDNSIEESPDEDAQEHHAAASLDVDGEKGKRELIVELVARGVDEPVAEKLVARYASWHIRAMLVRGEQEADGPGWYVDAIRKGYKAHKENGEAVHYLHHQAIRLIEEQGVVIDEAHPITNYFAVVRKKGSTFFVPTTKMQRLLAK